MARHIVNAAAVFWLILILGAYWVVEPGTIQAVAPIVPVVQDAYDVLWPLLHRPYVF